MRFISEKESSSIFGILPDVFYIVIKLIKIAFTIGIVAAILMLMDEEFRTTIEKTFNEIWPASKTEHTVQYNKTNTNNNIIATEIRKPNDSAITNRSGTNSLAALKVNINKEVIPITINDNKIRTASGLATLDRKLTILPSDIIQYYAFDNGKKVICAGDNSNDENCAYMVDFKIDELNINIKKQIDIIKLTPEAVTTPNGVLFMEEPYTHHGNKAFYYVLDDNSKFVCKGQTVRWNECIKVKFYKPN